LSVRSSFFCRFSSNLGRADDSLWRYVASKCTSKTHGYEETLRGVEESLDRFGFGGLVLPPFSFSWTPGADSIIHSHAGRLPRPFPHTRSRPFLVPHPLSLSQDNSAQPPSFRPLPPPSLSVTIQLSGTKKRLDTYRALVEKQKEGKLNSIGVSNLFRPSLFFLATLLFKLIPISVYVV
jgi:hypothetical protein